MKLFNFIFLFLFVGNVLLFGQFDLLPPPPLPQQVFSDIQTQEQNLLIHENYEFFQNNLKSKNYEQSLEVVDSLSKLFYKNIFEHCLFTKKSDLLELSFVEKYVVLIARTQIKKDDFLKMTVSEFILDQTGGKHLLGFNLLSLDFKNDTFAIGKLIDETLHNTTEIEFKKENGVWRIYFIDFVRLAYSDPNALTRYLGGYTEEEMLNIILKRNTKEEDVEKYWHPLKI